MKTFDFTFEPVSMLTREEPSRQRVELQFESPAACHIIIRVRQGRRQVPDAELAILSGAYHTNILLPPPEKAVTAKVQILSLDGDLLAEKRIRWNPPRQWELYVMLSSHTDIGLHNSQYIQRHNSADFIDKAIKLIDETEERPDENRYRYCMEGVWFWNNYALERSKEAAMAIAEKYIRQGKLGIAAGLAGNCTQIYGMEELCRSSYLRNALRQRWGIDCGTMTMIDNNGLSWALVEPYAEAGYRNLFWAPNPWNPIPSTIYTKDMSISSGTFTPQSCASGSRCDVRYGSALPMVFYWQGADRKSRLLVWASTQYGHGAAEFGLSPSFTGEKDTLQYTEMKMSQQLPRLEKCCPYDIWLMAAYGDDQEPSLNICNRIMQWNEKWAWPRFRTVGNLDEPFEKLRGRFGGEIPTLSGEITGGWYQLALCTPELLARKFAADTALPTAEKIAAVAAAKYGHEYPLQSFRRAWHALLQNDEHSYGASGYQGRRVYETWMQHRSWIELAEKTAQAESLSAMRAIADKIECREPSLLLFNPTLGSRLYFHCFKDRNGRERCWPIRLNGFGHRLVPLSDCPDDTVLHTGKAHRPPRISTRFFDVRLNENGAIASIFDKTAKREMLDAASDFHGNQILYTNDRHRSYHSTGKARFVIEKNAYLIRVSAFSALPELGAEIIQTYTMYKSLPRIDVENRILHAREMVNDNRYSRYIYTAFPFDVKDARKIVQLNGCIAQHGVDNTGHGTDTYSAAREWVAVENGKYGIALAQLDTSLVEFDHIHPDKTDYGAREPGSAIFSYVANDWLQMHTPGGSHIFIRCRYSIIPYGGDCRRSNVPEIAEQLVTPPAVMQVEPGKGKCRPNVFFFHALKNKNIRLLALKCSENGKCAVMRIRENKGLECAECNAFETKALALPKWRIKVKDEKRPPSTSNDTPEKVGLNYSGLIDLPRAARGEEDGMLYLLWGQNPEADVRCYELYRGTCRDFVPNEKNLVARVDKGEYCVARHVDTGLERHRTYFYRVRAVNDKGIPGPFSDEFSGVTKE